MAERLYSVIEHNLRQAGLWDVAMRHRAVEVWPEVVGERIAAQAKAVGVLGRSLVVRVENPGWRHQLHLMRLDLVARLNLHLGGKHIDDIRFTARRSFDGDVPAEQVRKHTWPGSHALQATAVTTHELHEIEQVTGRLGDSRLKSCCKRFALTLARRRRILESQGYGRCRICGSLSVTTLCAVCSSQIRASRQARANEILSRLPWLDSEGLRSVDPELGEQEYRTARETLVAKWTKEGFALASSRSKKALPKLRLLVADLAMLLTNTPPEKLTDEIIARSVTRRLVTRAGFEAK